VLNCREEYERMAQAERRLWWYRALHRLVLNALLRHPPQRDARILDAGCGTGGLLLFLREHGFRNLAGFDVSSDAIAICRERGLPVQPGDLRDIARLSSPETLDAIVSNDTLYFFSAEQQAEILKAFYRALLPGGLLILNLPALEAFRGIHDLRVGITKRFTKAQAQTLVSDAGFSVVEIMFWPFLLSPVIYLARLAQRRRLARGDVPIRSDLDATPSAMNRILEALVRCENALLPIKPFGSSLFLVARKGDERGK
jgi:SAM-dependent methyltransferase